MNLRWRLLSRLAIPINCIVITIAITFIIPVYSEPIPPPPPALTQKDIVSLLQQLKSKAQQDRFNALVKLNQYELPDHADSLLGPVLELFQHDLDQNIRIRAGEVLQKLLFPLRRSPLPAHTVYVAPVLEIFQHDSNQNIRGQAAQLLALDLPITPGSTKALFAALNDKDARFRQLVANCIPCDKKYLPEFLSALKNDDPMVRKAFIYKLGVCSPNQDSLIRTALINALKDPDASVAVAAARALQKTGANLPEADQLIDKHIIAGLTDPDKSVRQATLMELLPPAKIDPKYTSLLIKLLYDPDACNREFAADALTRVGPAGKAAIPDLTKAFLTSSPPVGLWSSCAALAKLGSHDPDVLDSLTRLMLTTGPSSASAAKSLEAFGKYSVPYLIKGLHDKNRYGQGLALGALSNIGKEASAAVPDLLAIWNPNDLYVPQVVCGQLPPYDLSPRWAAIDTLISIAPDDRRVVDALEPIALDKSNPKHQAAAIRSLKKIGTKDAFDIIKRAGK